MRTRLKKPDHHIASVTEASVQAKFLTHVRPMENFLGSTPIAPTTEDQQTQQQQEKQGFKFAEIPIFAGGAETSTPKIQAKFFPGDRSNNIMPQLLQRTEGEEEEPEQVKGESDARGKVLQPKIKLAPSGSGKAMPEPVQQKMEAAFGADFSGVRIHEGPQAKAINAVAYTQGSDIHFQPGKYQPETQSGQELLGHELTHVVQQKAGRVTVPQGKGAPINANPGLESEADILGAKAAKGEQVKVSGAVSAGISNQVMNPHFNFQKIDIQTSSILPVQRLMDDKQFEKLTELPGRLWGTRNRGGEIEKLDKQIKFYLVQPDVNRNKPKYLRALIADATEYIEKKKKRGYDEDSPRIKGTRALIESAQEDLQKLQSLQLQKQPEMVEDQTQLENPKVSKKEKGEYKDIDGMQYRITGRPPNRKIQQVKRIERVDENTVMYEAVGEVVDFTKGNMPIVKYYKPPISLGDWYPQITQLNGMNVKPTTGIRDAVSLQLEVNKKIDTNMTDKGLAIGEDTIDVLFTYSATHNTVYDICECIGGKIGHLDNITEIQAHTMMDAVIMKNRVIVCAHSRGTIKTDNAIELAYDVLLKCYQKEDNTASKQEIQKRVLKDMDTYIKVIYAGNAVLLPSNKLNIKMFVSDDWISRGLGTHSEFGKTFSGKGYTVERVEGEHSFSFYAQHAGAEAAKDIIDHQFDEKMLMYLESNKEDLNLLNPRAKAIFSKAYLMTKSKTDDDERDDLFTIIDNDESLKVFNSLPEEDYADLEKNPELLFQGISYEGPGFKLKTKEKSKAANKKREKLVAYIASRKQ